VAQAGIRRDAAQGEFMLKIRAEKDFWAGLVYVCLGAAFLWFGRDYRMGTGARMGPGYFPFVLSCIMIGLGVVSLARSLVVDGEKVGGLMWRPTLLICLSSVAFGLLLTQFGLVIALLALLSLSFYASRYFHVDARVLLGVAGLILFCVLVFVKGLGIPMPIFGKLFEPFLPQWLIR
jgi:hypothetical protein